MREMGGLRKKMPVTFATFMVGTLALCGVAPMAGFFSKDEILLSAGTYGYKTFMYLGFFAAALTTMYMTRATYLTFFGRYRGHAHPHESPRILTLPLMFLAVFSIPVGFANLPPLDHPLDQFAATASNLVLYEQAGLPSILTFSWGKAIASVIVVAVAFLIAYAYNVRKMFFYGLTKKSAPARWGHKLLVNKYYLDTLYEDGIVAGIKGPVANGAYWVNQNVLDGVVNGVGATGKASAKVLYNVLDQRGVDGAVNGVGSAASGSGSLLRKLQTGQVQTYAAWMFGAGALFVLYLALNA
jgi:NADH-quinone oxidoreductase subunit L